MSRLVTRTVAAGTPQFDAIAEEGFVSVDDVLEPSHFYGADLTDATREAGWPDNAKTIGGDVLRVSVPSWMSRNSDSQS